MTAELAQDTDTYHCIVCGPCLREHFPGGEVVHHNQIPHPDLMTFDEEDRPQ